MSNKAEKIGYDPKTDAYFILRYEINRPEQGERLPLSTWNLTKKVEVSALIVRKIEQTSFETPVRTLFYELPLVYEIEPKAKEFYLSIQDSLSEDASKKLVKVYVKNVDNGSAYEAPLPNSMFKQEDMPFLTITKGKARRLRKNEVYDLLLSKKCIGMFDYKMENRYT
jgi:hypothetical protein